MTAKQLTGSYTPDGAKYGTLTDGSNNLVSTTTSTTGSPKQNTGAVSPDGSIYFTLTNGSGTLI